MNDEYAYMVDTVLNIESLIQLFKSKIKYNTNNYIIIDLDLFEFNNTILFGIRLINNGTQEVEHSTINYELKYEEILSNYLIIDIIYKHISDTNIVFNIDPDMNIDELISIITDSKNYESEYCDLNKLKILNTNIINEKDRVLKKYI